MTWRQSSTRDGRTVVVAGLDDPRADTVFRNSHLLAIDVATGAKRRLYPQLGVWNEPVFSPDGRRIAFIGHPAVRATYTAAEVYVMNADGERGGSVDTTTPAVAQ